MSYLEKLRRLPKGPSTPAAGHENFKESLPAALPKLPKGGFDSTQGGRNSEKTPPPEHQGTRTESQWEDLTSIIAVLEHHPQLWPGLRAYSSVFRKRTLAIADAIVGTVAELRRYHPLTVRQVYYQLVSRLVVENNLGNYQKVSKVLVRLREEGIVSWDAITDRTRRTSEKRGMSNVREYLAENIEGFARPEYYGRCYVQDQDVHVEITSEKDALSSIIEDVAWPYCTRVTTTKGQCSATFVEQIADRVSESAMIGKRTILLHLGDLDPSGVAIPKAIERNITGRHGIPEHMIQVVRVGLTPDQVAEHRLPSSIDAVKPKDPNFKAWLEEYGRGQVAVELDALHPEIITKTLKEALESVYDMSGMDKQRRAEIRERALLAEVRAATLDFLHERFPGLFQ